MVQQVRKAGSSVGEGGTSGTPSQQPVCFARVRRCPRHRTPRVATHAGLSRGELRTKAFRHTYCAARLQTLDYGAPVPTYTVARELGHASEAMVRQVYAHLGTIRHRSEVVEYRVEQHLERLGDRLQRLGFSRPSDTGKDTATPARPETRTPHDHGSDGGAQAWDEWAMRGSNPRPRACEARALTS